MANIETTVNAMSKAKIMPEQPAAAEPPVLPEPTKVQIEQVVEMLAKPWQYGKFVARIERATGLPHATVMRIKAAYEAKRASLVAPVEPEVIE